MRVGGEQIAAIDRGLLVLLGVAAGDVEEHARWMAGKIVGMRIFSDSEGRFDRSVAEVGGAVLAVSQFTLYADTRKGRRPSFVEALGGDEARALYDSFVAHLRALEIPVESGRFGADMQVSLINDGPVTIILQHP